MRSPGSASLSLSLVSLQTTATPNDRVRPLRILSRLDAWLERVLLRRELRRLLETGDHLLEDLGFDAHAVATEVERRFWQPVVLKPRRVLEQERRSGSAANVISMERGRCRERTTWSRLRWRP